MPRFHAKLKFVAAVIFVSLFGSSQLLNAFQDNQVLPSSEFRQSSARRSTSTFQDDESPIQPRNEKYVDVTGGLTSPVAKVSVPARTSGTLEKISVVEMQEVAENELLAEVDMVFAQLQVESSKIKLEAAIARASDDVAIRYAQMAHAVADKERQINEKLARQGAGSQQESERSKLAAQQAQLQIEKSRHDLDVAGKEARVEEYNVNAAETNLTRHMISSPLSGNVVQILKQPGEWVNEGEEVFRIIQLNRMRVEGLVDIVNYAPSEIFGRPVTVTMNSAGKDITFEGKIVMVDMETTGGNRFTVRAEVDNRRVGENRWMLLSGATVNMRIHLQDPLASNPAEGETSKFTPR